MEAKTGVAALEVVAAFLKEKKALNMAAEELKLKKSLAKAKEEERIYEQRRIIFYTPASRGFSNSNSVCISPIKKDNSGGKYYAIS